MKKTIFLPTLILLLTVGLVSAATWTVDSGGSGDFLTIQSAINAAADGDIINVLDGTYVESLNVNNEISILGQSRAGTIIDASTFADYSIDVSADNVVLKSFTLKGHSTHTSAYGIKVSGGTGLENILIEDVRVYNTRRSAIDFNGIDNSVIKNVEVEGTAYGVGIGLSDSNNIDVMDVTTNANAWGGIAIYTTGTFYPPAGSDGVSITGTNSIGELVELYTEETNGVVTNLNAPDFSCTITTTDTSVRADYPDFTFYVRNQAQADVFKAGLVSSGVPESTITTTCKTVVATSGAPGNIGGSALIEATGDAPVIELLWVLPDEDPTSVDRETQINVDPGMERTDIYACFVASDLQGRDSLRKGFVKVYHPDGSYKYQAHATQLDPVDDESDIRDCVAEALAAGLISEEDANAELPNQQGALYNVLEQDNWHMYKVYLPMYYHQPAGDYTVDAYVTDATSGISPVSTRTFEWVAGTYLALDFTTVNFGSFAAESWKIANGDTEFIAEDGYPTLKNNGNTEIDVAVGFTNFVGGKYHKIINDFDAQLRSKGTANNYNEIEGEHLYLWNNSNGVEGVLDFTWPIELCRQEKIDFSIHADSGVVPDAYTGTITIYATGVDEYGVGAPPVDDNGDSIVFDGSHVDNPLE